MALCFQHGLALVALDFMDAPAERATVSLPGIHLHDLRHAGNTLTADESASLRELMERMGHSSTRAALIYQHSSDERQRALADEVGERAPAALRTMSTASGTEVARSPGQVS
jgi:integrase